MKTLLSFFSFFCTKSTSQTLTRTWRSQTLQTSQFILIIALFAGITFFSSTIQAQTLKAIPLDCGGHFSGFAQADNGRLYGYGDVFGAWRSDDGGSNWSYLNWGIQPLDLPGNDNDLSGGDIYGLGMEVQKNNADVVFYSTSNALYKSTNGGTDWTRLLPDLAFGLQPDDFKRLRGTSNILIRPNNSNEIWLAAPRKNLTGFLWKSINGGTDWVKAGNSTFDNLRVRTIHNVSTFANQIWVGTDAGLYVSSDGGNNFNLVGNSSTLESVGMISRFTTGAFAGVGLVTRTNGGGGGLSRITATDYNNSATYTVTECATVDLYFGYPTGLQIFSDGSSSAWNTGGDRHGFSPAGNGGQTFTVRNTSLNTNPVPIWTTAAKMTAKNHPDYGTDQVIEAVGNANKWMITGGGAPMYSMDKGLSWQYFPNQGGLAAVKTYRPAVSRYDVNRMYIPASDIGSVIVTDGGSSGGAALSSNKSLGDLHNALNVMEGPNSQNLVLAGNRQNENTNIFLKSDNGGTSWNELNVVGSGLPLSRDGVTKSVMSLTDANDFIVVLASSSDQRGTVTPGTINPGVWRTTNGGSNFVKVNGLGSNISTGARYSPQSAFLERDAVQTNVRYFTSRYEGNSPTASSGLFRSTDGGSNWSFVKHPADAGAWIWAFCADPIRGGNLWVATGWGGVKVSRDGGDNWDSSTQFFDAKFVSSCDGKIAIFGRAGGEPNPELLWYSADDGATWTVQTTVAKNFHNIQGITVDRNGKIWISWNSVTVVTPVVGTSTPVAVTGVSVTPSTASIAVGATQTLSSSVTPSTASQSVTWSSSNTSAATVSSSGVVTGVAVGTSTITATSVADNTKSQTATITVTAASVSITGVTLTPSTASIAVGATQTLTASVTPSTASQSVTWSSSNTSAATVSSSGIVTGVAAGTSTITATSVADNTKSQTATITVTAASTFPVITSRGENLPNEGIAKAFDSNNNTKWLDFSATSFLQIQYASAAAYNQFVMVSGNDAPERDPKNWTVQGSNNGTDWTVLNTQTNQTWTARNQAKTFTFSNTTAYSYYKLNITANGSGSIIQLSELTYSSGTTADTEKPTVPSSLTSSNLTATSLTLSWTASTDNVGVKEYEVFLGGNSLGTVTTTSYNATGLTASTAYSFTVRATDAATNSSAQSTALSVTTSAAAVTGSGNVTMETWSNVNGTTLATIPTTTTATSTSTLTSLETTSNTADNYGIRIRGYIIPSTTGSYTFYIASDDNGTFSLSTNDQSANLVSGIATVNDWTSAKQWDKYTTQKSTAKSLTAGTKYYFEALMKEGSGGDNFAIGWTGPGISSITVIGSANLDKFVTAATVSVTGVSLTPSTASISVSATQTLTASVTPSTASQSVTWSSSNTSVATVSSSGIVTGVAVGTSTITATSVADNTKSQTATITVTATVTATGNVTLETWSNVGGTTIATIPTSTTATITSTLTSLETANNTADNYGIRIRGYIIPSTTGSYTFYIASDDNGELRLSTNDRVANATRIAYHTEWTDSRQWNKYTTQKSVAQNLTAGTRYYFEALMKEGVGGDNFAIGWTGPGISTISVIGAANLDKFVTGTAGAIGFAKTEGLKDDSAKDSNINIYPNPASNSFNVATSGSAKIAITSLNGKLIKSISAKDKLTIIDSSNWSAGVYIIQVQEEGSSKISKVLITK